MGQIKMSKPIRFSNVSIPPEWTGEQAKAVIDFLEEICLTIWDVHERDILEATHQRESMLERPADEDDAFPF
jgi:hypothetical protein